MVVDPMGRLLGEAAEGEAWIKGEVDLEELEERRRGLPVLKHRRLDVYELKEKKK
jgi:predicted amidohydrolase